MRGFCLFFVLSLFACASLGQKPELAERRVSKEPANPLETVDPFKPLPPCASFNEKGWTISIKESYMEGGKRIY